MAKRPSRINQILGKSGLKKLLAKIRRQQALLELVRQQLPANVAKHCTDLHMQGTSITLFADSPVWASKLRFLAPNLLSQLRKNNPGIANLNVHSVPARHSKTTQKRRPHRTARHTQQGAATIDQSARSISHPGLKKALQKLATAVKPESVDS